MPDFKDNFDKVMDGLKPPKKVLLSVLTIDDAGTIKLFGITIRKGKKA